MNPASALEQLLNEKDILEFKRLFAEKKQSPKESILFTDFGNICKNAPCLREAGVSNLLETYKKELKTKTGIDSESGLMMSENDYYHYLKELAVAHNKELNGKDEKMRISFENLCPNGEYIKKSRLMEILDDFELGINYNEFFSSLKKSDTIDYDDFCCLFKASPEGEDIFRKTFGQDMMKPIPAEDNKDEHSGPLKNPDYPFPIIIVKKH